LQTRKLIRSYIENMNKIRVVSLIYSQFKKPIEILFSRHLRRFCSCAHSRSPPELVIKNLSEAEDSHLQSHLLGRLRSGGRQFKASLD
jgi:hypothetical protein